MSRARVITDSRYYKNTTKKGNPTTAKVGQSVRYYGYGVKEEGQEYDNAVRGEWLNPEGNEVSHQEVMAWSSEQALEHTYTYTMMFSVRDGQMEGSDFVEAMNAQEQFGDYRLIMHTDTEHDHAHIMAFSDKVLSRSEFKEWRREVRPVLTEREEYRLEQTYAWARDEGFNVERGLEKEPEGFWQEEAQKGMSWREKGLDGQITTRDRVWTADEGEEIAQGWAQGKVNIGADTLKGKLDESWDHYSERMDDVGMMFAEWREGYDADDVIGLELDHVYSKMEHLSDLKERVNNRVWKLEKAKKLELEKDKGLDIGKRIGRSMGMGF